MALTKEFEYDCEVRGAHKNVQVRKATIIKDDGEEISRTFTRHVLHCRKSRVVLGVTQISVVRTHQFKQFVMRFGLAILKQLMKNL